MRLPHPTRPPPPPPTRPPPTPPIRRSKRVSKRAPMKPPKLKRSIQWLEKRKHNLESRIRSNQTLSEKLKERLWEIEPLPESRINPTENNTCVRTYRVTGPLSHNVSNLILKTICPIIKMQIRVIYSFSCSIYQGWNQVVQYDKMLSLNGTFTSLNQIEEYIQQCEIWYLPGERITDNHGVYEGCIEFHHVRIWLISSNEQILGCSPLPDWLRKKRCIYTVNDENDSLCIW